MFGDDNDNGELGLHFLGAGRLSDLMRGAQRECPTCQEPQTKEDALIRMYQLQGLRRTLYDKRVVFEVGSFVTQKPGLGTIRVGGPFIVTQVLREPIISPDTDSSSSNFREPLDLVVGHITHDGLFTEHYVDSRRLQPYVMPHAEGELTEDEIRRAYEEAAGQDLQ